MKNYEFIFFNYSTKSLQRKKKGSDDESEDEVAVLNGSDDEFDALINSSAPVSREKPGRRAASKVRDLKISLNNKLILKIYPTENQLLTVERR